MKTNILATSIFGLVVLASPTLADEQVRAEVKDHYKWITTQVPVTESVCHTTRIPIYEEVRTHREGNAAGGALLGMIIGGVAGKAITGKDNGAAAGAVMGGLIGADQAQRGRDHVEQRIVGYKNERVCNDVTTYTERRERVYDYSTIKWKIGNAWYTHNFTK